MARLYAGILGPLAFSTTLVRGLLHGGSPESVLGSALVNLLAFAVVGGLVGAVAQKIVEDAIFSRYAAALNGEQAARMPESGSRR